MDETVPEEEDVVVLSANATELSGTTSNLFKNDKITGGKKLPPIIQGNT